METGLGASLIGPYMGTCTGCCKCLYRVATLWLVPGAMEKGECQCSCDASPSNPRMPSTFFHLQPLVPSPPSSSPLLFPVYPADKEKQQKLLVNKESKEKRADMRDQQKQKVGHMTSHDLSPAPLY